MPRRKAHTNDHTRHAGENACRKGEGDERVNGEISMTLARQANSWPRRGHTTVATGDQREPVVAGGNVPVPGGGECVGTLGAIVVRPLRVREEIR
jgi:hypothetical protein